MTETIQYQNMNCAYSKHIQSVLENSNNYYPFKVTIRFKFIPLSSASRGKKYKFFSDDIWKQYSKIYRFITSNLGNHIWTKPHLLPLTFDFLDVDGTRYNPFASFTENTIPHTHSIYLIHEQTLERFQSLVDSGFQPVVEHPSNEPFVRSIHAEPITHDLPRVVSYCSKFYDTYQARAIRDDYPLFNQFPLTEFEKEQLQHERQSLPFYRDVQALRNLKTMCRAYQRELFQKFSR